MLPQPGYFDPLSTRSTRRPLYGRVIRLSSPIGLMGDMLPVSHASIGLSRTGTRFCLQTRHPCLQHPENSLWETYWRNHDDV